MAISDPAADASRRGTPLLPGDQGVQVAGKGSVIVDIFRMLNLAPKRATEGVPTSVEEGAARRGRALGEPDPYQQSQENLAPQLLSPEGQQRFDAAGGVASDAITPPRSAEALDVLDELDVDPSDAARVIRAAEPEQVDSFVRSGAEGLDFNFGRLETSDDVKRLFNEVSEIYADPTEAAKRGVISHGETLEQAEGLLADELGFTRKLLKRRTGELLNAEQATAARILLVRSAERLVDLARVIHTGDDSSLALLAFRKHMAIHAGIQMQVKGMQTEIARALSAFNIPAGARTAEARAMAAAEMLRQSGGAGEAKKLAAALLKAEEKGGSAAVHGFAFRGWASAANGIFQEVYVNGLLSWTYTHVKNFFATPIFMAYQTAEEVLAGVVGGIERGVGKAIGAPTSGYGEMGLGSTAEGVYSGQAVARMFGWSRSLKDALITAGETFKNEVGADVLTKVEQGGLRAIDAEALKMSGMPGRAIDALGRTIRIPGRALMAADDFWRVFSQRGELYAEAYSQARRATSLGKTDQEAVDNAAMVILDPRSYAGQLDEAARYNTLTSDMGFLGEIATMIQRFPVMGRILMPFAKAPTNAILRSMERMGVSLGYFKNPVARQKAVARAAMGYGVMYAFAEYAVSGRVTGAMPRDRRQRDMLPPGWRPYSLVFRGDNWPTDADGDDLPIFDQRTGVPNGALTYVSYAGLEPIGAVLGIAATTVERMRRSNDPEVRANLATNAIAAAGQYITDMPMIQTVGEIVSAFERGDISFIAEGPLKSFMPYSAAVRAGERVIDPTQRRASGAFEYYTLKDVQSMPVGYGGAIQYELVGQIKGGLGGSFTDAMAKWRSMLTDRVIMGGASDETSAIQYDVFGNERKMGVRFDINPVAAMWNLIMPFNIRKGKTPTALERLQIALQGPLRTAKEREGGFAFTGAFQAEWTRVAKKKISVQNPATGTAETFMQSLANLVGSFDFTAMTEQEKFNAMRDVEDRFYDSALKVVFSMPQYQDVARAYRDYTAVREILKNQGKIRR